MRYIEGRVLHCFGEGKQEGKGEERGKEYCPLVLILLRKGSDPIQPFMVLESINIAV